MEDNAETRLRALYVDAPRLLVPSELADSALLHFEAELHALDDSEERPPREEAVLTTTWTIVKFGRMIDEGFDPLVFADEESADAGHLAASIFEDGSTVSEDLQEAALLGCDVLMFESFSVKDGEPDPTEAVSHVIETVLQSYGAGCMGAAFTYNKAMDAPYVMAALRDRSFAPRPGFEDVWFATRLERRLRPEVSRAIKEQLFGKPKPPRERE